MAQCKVDKHGLPLINLRQISGLTKGIRSGSSYHIEIAYDLTTGKICYEEHVGPVGSSFVTWDSLVFPCGYLSRPMSMQDIADQVLHYMEPILGGARPL